MDFVFELNETVIGHTHCKVRYLLDVAGPDRQLEIPYFLGTLDEDGEFVASDLIGQKTRTVKPDEMRAFLAWCQDDGAPEGEYRISDLVGWVTIWGLVYPTWRPPEPTPEPEGDQTPTDDA